MALVSILVPLYNEEEFVLPLLDRVLAASLPSGLEREILVVDDGSDDGSGEAVRSLLERKPGCLRLFRHERNRGKGAAIRTAIGHAQGEFAIIQDADLEYDPREYPRLLQPLLDGRADAVYGSRFQSAGERRVLYFWHALANRFLTGLCNLVADLNLTDMGTGYKACRTQLLKSIPLRSDRFGIEPELTIKLARRDARIYETPVSYHGRTYEEGKKIGFRDAVATFFVILRYWFTGDLYRESGPEVLETLSHAPRFNRWVADVIRPYLGSRVLEIGAGIGNLTRHLIPRRQHYIATEMDPEHLARLAARLQHRPNLEPRLLDLTNGNHLADLAGVVDTVVCVNVLEHIEDDRAALQNIHAVLEAGGRAVILVPQDPSLYGSLDKALGHWRRYRPAELRKLLLECGFRLECLLEFNRISRPGWYVTGKWLRRRTLSAATMKLFDRLVWLWRRIDRFLPWGPVSLIAVAVKEDPIPGTTGGPQAL